MRVAFEGNWTRIENPVGDLMMQVHRSALTTNRNLKRSMRMTTKTTKKGSAPKPKVSREPKAAPKKEKGAQVAAPKPTDVPENARLQIMTEKKANPRREGTAPYDHWEQHVKHGITIKTFLENGGEWMHLRADIARGHVQLVERTN